jgi:hypothetical protein
MECTSCHNILNLDKFSLKNEAKKIYYLHCNACREKIINDPNKKKREKEQYEKVKMNNVINCKCGIKYIAFRDYHILRHTDTQTHQIYLENKNANKILHKTC